MEGGGEQRRLQVAVVAGEHHREQAEQPHAGGGVGARHGAHVPQDGQQAAVVGLRATGTGRGALAAAISSSMAKCRSIRANSRRAARPALSSAQPVGDEGLPPVDGAVGPVVKAVDCPGRRPG